MSRPGSSRPTSSSTRRSSEPNTSHQPLETRTAMAYWQNGKLYMHCSTQSTMRTIGAVARWVGIEPEDVVIISEYTGGGFGSKGSGIGVRGHPGAAVEEDQCAGDDAHHARRGAVHRPRPAGAALARQGRLQEGRPHHRHRRARHRRQRPLRRRRRCAVGRRSHLAVVSAAGDAVAQPVGADQHAAARRAARAGRHAGQRAHGADPRQGGAASSASTRSRSIGSTRPKARRRSARPNARGAQNRDDQRVPEAGARQGRRAVQLGRAEGAQRPARRDQGPRRRRRA